MQDYWIDFESLPWESVMDGVRQKVIAHSGKKVRLVEYSKAMPPHWCTKGHYGYILKGRFEIEFADRTHIFEEGGVDSGHVRKIITFVIARDLKRAESFFVISLNFKGS